jgi:predicted NodU family carbamoyl transferase
MVDTTDLLAATTTRCSATRSDRIRAKSSSIRPCCGYGEPSATTAGRSSPLESALADLRAGASVGAISEALHNGLAVAIAEVAIRIREQRVVLSGGCFQNVRLIEGAVAALRAGGFDAIWHQHVPPNDGGIALGQAVWAAWCEQRGGTRFA